NFKKGNDTKNFEARQFIRMMDEFSQGTTFNDWIPLNGSDKGFFRVVMDEHAHPDAREVFGEDKVDHRILNAALALKAQYPTRRVILVTKDINLRIKAKSLLIEAEDFETGKVQDISSLYTGKSELFLPDSRLIEAIYTRGYIEKEELPAGTPTFPNHYYLLTSENSSALAYMNPETNRVERVERKEAYGIRARNVEQVFALHALLNPQVRLVTLQGVAGTGKTLLALAAALETRRQYWQIYLARPIVPLSNKDIGYLPGDIKSKLHPYMEPLYDNLKYIQSRHGENDKEARKINELLENEKLVIQPLAYIRGRSLSNVFFIVDEAQNLTPHEIKTIITRAGEGTKVVFTGDIFQID
ncbi:MAG: PhoH family protein, partial [Chitinophagales bacterium]|nr:PhoH family protein [Chitinophagales bacterium]